MLFRSRVALNQMARIQFLQRDYAKALKTVELVCLVDPEDIQAHYTAMLAQRGMGNEAEAEREQKLFMRFKTEESAQAITGARRLLKPEENNERQAIHQHESVGLQPAVAGRPSSVAAGKSRVNQPHVGGQ